MTHELDPADGHEHQWVRFSDGLTECVICGTIKGVEEQFEGPWS